MRHLDKAELFMARIPKVVFMVDIVQGRALRDLEIGEEFYNDNDHTMIVTLSVYKGMLLKEPLRYLYVS